DDDHRVRGVLLDLLGDALDDLDVGLDEVVAAHPGLAGESGGDDDDVRALDVLVVARALDRGVESLDRRAAGEVDRLALGDALFVRDVQEDDIAQLLGGGPHGAGGPDIASTDDSDLRATHGKYPFRMRATGGRIGGVTQTADRFSAFGTTIFAEISALALEHGAINLGQGFPDFDGPEHVKAAATRAMADGHNQYAPLPGVPELRGAIARSFGERFGVSVDPAREVTVTCGCTEAIAATLSGLVNPGDEVVLFEPFYDSYRACVSLAGATARFVTLRADANGRFTFDPGELRAAFNEKTRAVLVNTPHNPTGVVFSREELRSIADLCIEHDAIAISDEVYEHIVMEGEHVPIATLDGMRDRTVTLSSFGKTFSMTGWKIGWAIAPPALTSGVRSAHQFLTFAIATPLQHAAAEALASPPSYFEDLRAGYRERRDLLVGALREIGFSCARTTSRS
ncbi:dapC, partial [Symbiodinium necroappetens]